MLRTEDDADGRSDRQLLALDDERLDERGEERVGHLDRLVEVVEIGQQNGELVAAEPRHRVGGAQAARQAASHLAQHLVPALVAEGVVDLLEAVQVHEQEAQRLGGAAALQNPLFQPVVEQEPVRQAGEGVVQRLAPQLLLGQAALRNLAFEVLVRLGELGGARQHAALEQVVGLAQLLLHPQALEELGHRHACSGRRRRRGAAGSGARALAGARGLAREVLFDA